MVEFAITLPIIKGKEKALKYLVEIITDQKRKEFQASKKRLGIDKETWFSEISMRGGTLILYQEGPDIQKSFAGWIESQDPFDVWLKNQMKEITGIEFDRPVTAQLPTPLLRYPF